MFKNRFPVSSSRVIWLWSGLIDVCFHIAASDWIMLQEENSSCKFGALQVIKVVRARSIQWEASERLWESLTFGAREKYLSACTSQTNNTLSMPSNVNQIYHVWQNLVQSSKWVVDISWNVMLNLVSYNTKRLHSKPFILLMSWTCNFEIGNLSNSNFCPYSKPKREKFTKLSPTYWCFVLNKIFRRTCRQVLLFHFIHEYKHLLVCFSAIYFCIKSIKRNLHVFHR